MKQRTGVPHEFGRIDPQLRQDSVGKLGDSAAAHTGELGDGSGGDPPRGGERIRRFGMGGEREREREEGRGGGDGRREREREIAAETARERASDVEREREEGMRCGRGWRGKQGAFPGIGSARAWKAWVWCGAGGRGRLLGAVTAGGVGAGLLCGGCVCVLVSSGADIDVVDCWYHNSTTTVVWLIWI